MAYRISLWKRDSDSNVSYLPVHANGGGLFREIFVNVRVVGCGKPLTMD